MAEKGVGSDGKDGVRRARGRVLIIDDSEAARGLIRTILRRTGFETFELPSAIGATRVIVQAEIQVLIVDITMPGLSGDKLIEVLRRNPRLADLIILIVSGAEAAELERLRRTCGADEVVAKRDVQESLVATVLAQICRSSSTRLVATTTPAVSPASGSGQGGESG